MIGKSEHTVTWYFMVRHFFCARTRSRSMITKSIDHILFHNTQSCSPDRVLDKPIKVTENVSSQKQYSDRMRCHPLGHSKDIK